VPAGLEEVDVLEALEAAGDGAVFQAGGYQVSGAFRLFGGAVEDPLQLLLHEPHLGCEDLGEANHYGVAAVDGIANLVLPFPRRRDVVLVERTRTLFSEQWHRKTFKPSQG